MSSFFVGIFAFNQFCIIALVGMSFLTDIRKNRLVDLHLQDIERRLGSLETGQQKQKITGSSYTHKGEKLNS